MIWAIIIITGLLTFFMRFIMLSGIAPRKLPSTFREASDFIPIAVLTAIIVPAVLTGEDNNIMLLDNSHLPAAIVAVVVALISRSVVLTIGVGLSILWLLNFMGFS
jgi:branched-subunit amino acid transport protein